jgi:hypothetical protein
MTAWTCKTLSCQCKLSTYSTEMAENTQHAL